MPVIDIIFSIIVVVMSVVVHEVSHGLVAEKLGDPTARLQGRLTLNPLKHLDPLGSVILPAIMAFINPKFIIGWAKPVPYNPRNISHRYGDALVAGAGPLSNIILVIIFGLIFRFAGPLGFATVSLYKLLYMIVVINCGLAIFNLMPIPPLDGSKILFSLLPKRARAIEQFLEQNVLVVLIVFIFILSPILSPIILGFARLATGV
jgi:Zn-dependent protease